LVHGTQPMMLPVRFAQVLLVATCIGWPASAFTWARGEPQFILGLSWLALTLTALDVLFTADVRREQDEDSEELTRRCEHCGHRIDSDGEAAA
jgi:hypothetical protein